MEQCRECKIGNEVVFVYQPKDKRSSFGYSEFPRQMSKCDNCEQLAIVSRLGRVSSKIEGAIRDYKEDGLLTEKDLTRRTGYDKLKVI